MIEFSNISKTFELQGGFFSRKKKIVHAVESFSLKIDQGETVGLVGESGSGKSTVARLLMGMYPPTSGHFTFEEFDSRTMNTSAWRALRRRLGVVFQDPAGSMNPWFSAAEIIEEPLIIQKRNIPMTPSARRDKVIELLASVGIPESSTTKKIHEFSGGQRQRIAIARALVLNPRFLIFDEPISALDVSIQAQILNLLVDLRNQFQFTALFISHDLNIVRWFSHRIAVMYLGHLVEVAPAELLFSNPHHPYSLALAQSRLEIHNSDRTIFALSGEIPSPINPPPGCPFGPRCSKRSDACTKQFPAKSEIASRSYFCYNPVAA